MIFKSIDNAWEVQITLLQKTKLVYNLNVLTTIENTMKEFSILRLVSETRLCTVYGATCTKIATYSYMCCGQVPLHSTTFLNMVELRTSV